MKNMVDLSCCPERPKVARLIELLRDSVILEEPEQLETIEALLREQVTLVCGGIKAEETVMSFQKELPGLRGMLHKDLQAAYDGDPAAGSLEEILLSYPGFFAVMVYRVAHFLYEREIPLLPRMMTEYAHSLTGIDIHPGARIGSCFFMDHGTGIVIGETTLIGENVKLYQGVTLGALSTRGGQDLKGKKRHPTIEDGVTIYAGASILGGDTVIGRNCVIGSNVFITQSVPPKTTVRAETGPLCFGIRTES